MKKLSEDLTSIEFKKAARMAIFALAFFIISYLLLLSLAIAFAVLCGFLGIGLITLQVHWITLVLGAGLIIMGLIVVFFLIKFIFKRHKVDRSNLIELREEEAPLLYQDIREIVAKVETNFPKKIFLSHEVNASVFYDSTFLSMIFPVKKNLQIGMALINTVSRAELKAILAHEFGHFSQRSMKVGSYVYTVNQIIFNMLYDNEGYGKVIQKVASISNGIAIFATLGIKIIEGIQWILGKLYNLVNLQHLSLSREMEFHADAIAVNIIGSKPFVSSMMRLDLSNNAFDRTLGYYEQKISLNIKPKNIYPQHRFIMDMLAEDIGLAFVSGLPNVTDEHLNRYNKSKLVIKNQWASHPSTEDRIAAISNGNFPEGEESGEAASVLFADIEHLQFVVTTKLFSNVVYKGEVSADDYNNFEVDFKEEFERKGFPKLFNGYYDNYNPTKIDLEQSTVSETAITFEQLYANEKIDALYSSFSLEADINTLKQIQTEETGIKSFEYDGVKYQKYEISDLLPKLETELNDIKTSTSVNDVIIHEYFKKKA
ncbi:heat shock protein HtpX [compost metagenome]